MLRRPLLSLCLFAACVEVSTVEGPPSKAATAPPGPGEKPASPVVKAEAEAPVAAVDPKPATPPTAAPTQVGEGAEVEFPTPSVEPRLDDEVLVIDAGREPKQTLTLSPRKGHKQSFELSIKMRVAMEVGTQKVPPTPIPEITVVMDTEVEKVEPAIVYRFSTRDARRAEAEGGSSRVAKAVDEAVQSLAAAKGKITMTNGGLVRGIDLELSELSASGMKPAIQGFRQSFSQLFPTFPKDAVGLGARWKAVTHFESAGLQIQQVTTYELVRRDGPHVELEVRFDQAANAPAQRDLGGAKMDVASFGGSGEGTIELRLDAVAPKTGRAQSRSASQSKIDMGGGGQPLALKTELELALSEVDPSG